MIAKQEKKKKIDVASKPIRLFLIFSKLDKDLMKLDTRSPDWLIPSRPSVESPLVIPINPNVNVRFYLGFRVLGLDDHSSHLPWILMNKKKYKVLMF